VFFSAPLRVRIVAQLFSQTLVVRVYILRGIQLKAMDVGGSSDPYLVLKHGPGLATSVVDKKRYNDFARFRIQG
jgi:hypothetical protein